MLPRRALLAALSLPALPAAAADEDGPAAWEAFKSRFLQPGGRVVDTGNQGVSHTEGQGWGMTFAEHFADRPAFDAIWGWTARTLRRPHDALHAWRFDPSAANPVADPNNATDGDLFIALALSRAARRWNDPAYAAAASALARDIIRLLVRKTAGRTILLPGAAGFESPAGTVLNPSYYVFPALRELSTRLPSPEWVPLQRDGAALIAQARFGRWQLPPDWLLDDPAGAHMQPAPNWPPRFSYDAIRVPLYLAWAGLPAGDGVAAYLADFHGQIPAWTDLTTNETAPYAAAPGMLAALQLAQSPRDPPPIPPLAASPDYYSAALTMLTRLVARELRA